MTWLVPGATPADSGTAERWRMDSGRILVVALIVMLALAGMGSALLVQQTPAVAEAVELQPRDAAARRPSVRLTDGAGDGIRATQPPPAVNAVISPPNTVSRPTTRRTTASVRQVVQHSDDDDGGSRGDDADD